MKFDKTGITTNVIATILATLLLTAFSFLTNMGRSFWRLLASWIEELTALFINRYATPGWVLALLVIFCLPSLGRVVRYIFKKESPEYYSYTRDSFHGAIWKWQWSGQQIINLWCYCPICDATLVYDDSSCNAYVSLRGERAGTAYICEHCGNRKIAFIEGGDKYYTLSAIQREITRKIRTGEYKKH